LSFIVNVRSHEIYILFGFPVKLKITSCEILIRVLSVAQIYIVLVLDSAYRIIQHVSEN